MAKILMREVKSHSENNGSWVRLERFLKVWKEEWNRGKSEVESTQFRRQQCWDQSEYWEEPRRTERTGCHSDCTVRPSVNAGVRNSKEVKY